MEKELQGLSHSDLVELCTKTREFLMYIDKEYTNVEKMRDGK